MKTQSRVSNGSLKGESPEGVQRRMRKPGSEQSWKPQGRIGKVSAAGRDFVRSQGNEVGQEPQRRRDGVNVQEGIHHEVGEEFLPPGLPLSGLICFLFWVVGGAVVFSFSFGSDVDSARHMRVFLQGVFKAPT